MVKKHYKNIIGWGSNINNLFNLKNNLFRIYEELDIMKQNGVKAEAELITSTNIYEFINFLKLSLIY